MLEKLITDFFNTIEKNEAITSRHGKAVFFVEEILEKKYEKFNYVSVQTISRLQRKYIDKEMNVPVGVPNSFIKDTMAQYLNYRDYEDFKSIHSPTPFLGKKKIHYSNKNHISELNTQKTPVTLSMTVTAMFVFVFNFNLYDSKTNHCHVWKDNHYEKVPCDYLNTVNNTNKPIDITKLKKEVIKDSTCFLNNVRLNHFHRGSKIRLDYFLTDNSFYSATKKELTCIMKTLKAEGILKE